MPILPTGTSNNRQGFTLVELVVVIVILGLIGAISVPLLFNRLGSDERSTLRRIVGTVKELYNEATLTRDVHQLEFDLDRNTIKAYRLRSVAVDRVEKEPFRREIELAPLTIQQIEVEGQGSFRSGQVTVRIFPLGWMEQTRLHLRYGDGTDIQLIFSPLTGTTRIEEAENRVR
ncbi:prepilin-type N-terminal cleavage/methylation domain-containing protein [Pelovirga terrestris]|uniref:Prepilin-type N-terminal cleavage/methylation domain-containing protein n=1 Tax=Pelovirga terrestris TaxID=2771352 RepID=A0A8J6UGW3_9BACT|nr:prepilin-type N-terminal cleavage/methylation domain-containing protein [Pelovirga terrestris]MBD1400483.1 prepilin-type N-terminal cleavage/methylation domain-containing protein [Pelovirga terrestris]